MREITGNILHCAGVPSGWSRGKSVTDIIRIVNDWHVKDRGWKQIGYHFVVDPWGNWMAARDINIDGAHVIGHNKGTVGILMVEHTRITRVARMPNYFNLQQAAAVDQIVVDYDLPKVFAGHNDYAARLCPGFHVPYGIHSIKDLWNEQYREIDKENRIRQQGSF